MQRSDAPAVVMGARQHDVFPWGRWAVLVLALILVLVSVSLPSADISWMRHRWRWFTYPLDWIESMHSVVNLVHLFLFLLLGMAMRLALPQRRIAWMFLALVALGVSTELVQFFIPGRQPRVSDAVVDVVAGLAGWGIVHALAALVMRWFLRHR